MTTAQDITPDRSILVYRHHEQLYRLALVVAGDADRAAELVERAYRDLPEGSVDVEAALIRALLAKPVQRWSWRARHEDIARAALDTKRADAILDTLAAMSPEGRLTAGLHYLQGMAGDEITAVLGE